MEWHELKNWLSDTTMLDRDALHIYAALLIQLVSAWLFRRSIASPLPWITVLVFALVNEYYDYGVNSPTENGHKFMMAEIYHDLWNTMLAPTVLLIVARFWPHRLVSSSGGSTAAVDSNEKDE